MLRRFMTLLVTLGLPATTGCDNEPLPPPPVAGADRNNDEVAEPVEDRLCERIQECGYLDHGPSVDECIDVVGACAETLPVGPGAGWDQAAEDCLGLGSCQLFGGCLAAIDTCVAEVGCDLDSPPECLAGEQTCVGSDALEVCVDGSRQTLDCLALCGQHGFETSLDCTHDADSDADVCICG